MRARVLLGPMVMLLMVGCRTIDDDRHWGYRHYHHGHHHSRDRSPSPVYRPLAPPAFHPPAVLPPSRPAFRPPEHRWYREPNSGAGRDHRPRHRQDGPRDHRRGR